MNHKEGSFCGSGGLDLYCQSWLPGSRPSGLLVFVHGQGDHSGRFGRLVEPLVAGSFGVYGFDLHGFGRSPGRKGHINRWEEYREDVQAFLAWVREQQPGLPVFLMGYSLGALIVLDYILNRPEGLRGAVLSSLPIQPAGAATPARVFMARVFSRLWPTFSLNMDGDYNDVTRDEAVQEALRQDPLHHGWVTARWGAELLSVRERLARRAAEIRLPVLFIHGGDDPVGLVSGVERFFELVTYPDKTLKIYPGSRHETHNDLDHAQVAAGLLAWLNDRLPKADRPVYGL